MYACIHIYLYICTQLLESQLEARTQYIYYHCISTRSSQLSGSHLEVMQLGVQPKFVFGSNAVVCWRGGFPSVRNSTPSMGVRHYPENRELCQKTHSSIGRWFPWTFVATRTCTNKMLIVFLLCIMHVECAITRKYMEGDAADEL